MDEKNKAEALKRLQISTKAYQLLEVQLENYYDFILKITATSMLLVSTSSRSFTPITTRTCFILIIFY